MSDLRTGQGPQDRAARTADWAGHVPRLSASQRDRPGRVDRQRRRAGGWPGPSRASARCGRRPTACELPRDRVSADGADRDLEGATSASSGRRATRFYAPLTGIAPGEVALINIDLPGRMQLVHGRDGPLRRRRVVHAHDAAGAHVRRLDHLQRDREGDGVTIAQAQVLDARLRPGLRARPRSRRPPAGGPCSGSRPSPPWPPASGTRPRSRPSVVCVDARRQWSRWRQRVGVLDPRLHPVRGGRPLPGGGRPGGEAPRADGPGLLRLSRGDAVAAVVRGAGTSARWSAAPPGPRPGQGVRTPRRQAENDCAGPPWAGPASATGAAPRRRRPRTGGRTRARARG